MGHSVEITTRIPTVDEVAERVGVSKTKLRRLQEIVDAAYPVGSRTEAANLLNGHYGDTKVGIKRKRSSLQKKDRSAVKA